MKNYTKKSLKPSNGITLIALVVTIIVLLILAGISISMLSGDNGILQKATDAKEQTGIGQEKEIVALAYNSALAKKLSNGDSTSVTAGDLNIELANQGASADGSNPITVTFTDSKRHYTINSSGTVTEVTAVTLTFNANGGAFSDNATTKTVSGYSGDTETLPTAPTKTNYVFNGWYTATTGGTLVYSATDTTGELPVSITTVYAQWREGSFLGTAQNTEKYGYKVSGYTAASYSGTWRLFYQDANNTYIIADMKDEGTLSNRYGPYTDGSYVSAEGKNLNSKLDAAGTYFIDSNNSTDVRAIAWLTDTSPTSLWSTTYKDTGTGAIASYAIGSPTIELFYASYKATHSTTTATIEVSTGYYPVYRCSGLTSYGSLSNYEYHGIYGPTYGAPSGHYWLSSPSSRGYLFVLYSGRLEDHDYYYVTIGTSYNGVRPVVSIPTSAFESRSNKRNFNIE